MWSALVGFGVPPLVAVFVQSSWPSWVKALFTFGVCALGGGVTAALTGYMGGMSPARSVLVVLFSALTFYRMFWRPSAIAPKIEAATNVKEPAGLESWQELAPKPDADPAHHRWPPR
jgi:hypothetical protein